MLLCFTVSPYDNSCRPLAKNCRMLCTNMMLPAESLLDSPKRSLLQEKVGLLEVVSSIERCNSIYGQPASSSRHCTYYFKSSPFNWWFFVSTALATLKPQAGLVAPQAVSAAQPAAAVSYNLHNSKMLIMILRKTFLCLYLRVLVESLWRLMNRWE